MCLSGVGMMCTWVDLSVTARYLMSRHASSTTSGHCTPFLEHWIMYCVFVWCRDDVYMGRPISHSQISYEQACILYNIGALHSILGALDNRQTPEVIITV